MTLRPYEASDYEACLALFESNMPKYFLPEEKPDFTGWLKKYENNGPYEPGCIAHYFVVEEDGVAVACGGLYMEPHNSISGMIWGW